MPLKTTVIGAWPKPSYLQLKDWFNASSHGSFDVTSRNKTVSQVGESEIEKQTTEAVTEVVKKQEEIGIDIITDGEVSRDTYYLHFCHNLHGIDTQNTADKVMRSGAYTTQVPCITGPISVKKTGECAREWKRAQSVSSHVVKYTVPGPMTILDGMVDQYYGKEKKRQLIEDLIQAINEEVRQLEMAGCKVIQIDEPVMMRYPELAMQYGIDDVTRCLSGLSDDVTTIVHLCCGYPEHIDDNDYLKADKTWYKTLAKKLDATTIKQVSIEDAECLNDLSLLEEFHNMTVILGVVTIARSHVETVQEISARVGLALQHIPASRLILAPDCGLGFLTEELITAKLTNLVQAARSIK